MFSNSVCLRLMEIQDKSAAMVISAEGCAKAGSLAHSSKHISQRQ